MGKKRKRLSGGKRRDIKKKWKARTIVEKTTECSEVEEEEGAGCSEVEEEVCRLNVDSSARARYFKR